MSFKNYYEQVQKTFDFRIKSVGRLGDEEMDKMELVLDKYRPSKIGKPKKMMFQTFPLGFTGVKNVEVWFFDVTLTVPAHAPTLAYDLRQTFGLSGNSGMIQVSDPHAEDDAKEAAEEAEKDAEKDGEALLLTDPLDKDAPNQVDADELFGDTYNRKFLSYVKEVEEKRELNQKVDAPHPLSKWANQPDPEKAEPEIDTTNVNDYLDKEQPKFKAHDSKSTARDKVMTPDDALNQLRALLRSVNVSDEHLKRGVRLTQAGIAKVAAKFGITNDEVEGMLNSLRMEVLNEEAPRFSFEEDYIGNITLRDAKTGRDKFVQGDEAFKLSDELSANPDRQEEILAPYFDVENLNEEANPAAGIVSDRGTFNFPYKGKFATAIYGLDKEGVFILNVESLRDEEDIEVDITPSMRRIEQDCAKVGGQGMNNDMRKLMTLINEAVDIDPNSSPDTYEDRDAEHYDALEKTGFFGSQGAGAILIAKTTGRIMLCLRSAQVLEPFTWGNCGGAHGKDERPIEAAKREVYEETGYTGSISMVPLMVFSKEGFRYCNFLAIVEEEFEPSLGWEADRAVWVQYGRFPRPLHFGMQSLFADQESAKVIRHYAAMFSQGEDVSESLSENLDLPAGVDTAKAIAKAQEVAQELADEEEEEVAAATGTAPVKAPVQGQQGQQQGQQGQPPKAGAPVAPAAAATPNKPVPAVQAGKKSLAAIKPQ